MDGPAHRPMALWRIPAHCRFFRRKLSSTQSIEFCCSADAALFSAHGAAHPAQVAAESETAITILKYPGLLVREPSE